MDKTRYIFILRSRIRSQIVRRATVKIEREPDITENLQRQEKKVGGYIVSEYVWNDVWSVDRRWNVSALVVNLGENNASFGTGGAVVLASAKSPFKSG